MRCEAARRALSIRLDQALAPADDKALTAHLAGCQGCARLEPRLLDLRRQLRVEPLGVIPDVAARVRIALEAQPGATRPGRRRRSLAGSTAATLEAQPEAARPGRRRRSLAGSMAAALVAGAVAGATFVGLNPRRPAQVVAADLGAELLAAQSRVTTLTATVTVSEFGWAPHVPVRDFRGTLRYQAPESISLQLTDRTHYPSGRWHPSDVAVVVTPTQRWSQGQAGCPVAALPGCQSAQPRRQAVIDREPFGQDSPALDLVVPIGSFDIPTPMATLPTRQVGGRTAIGIHATVAQLAPLLAGLEQAGNWRDLYPADPADVWLDRASLVPLQVTVRAGSGPDRARWAAQRGYQDQPSMPVLELTFSQVALNAPLQAGSFPAPPSGTTARDAAFHDGPLAAGWPAPAWLPPNLQPYRSGVVTRPGGSPVAVRSWTDGLSWLEVAATRSWSGGALFGDLGDIASRQVSAKAGVLYVGERGDRVGLHGGGIDVVVRGSVAQADLVSAAESLGVRGLEAPAGWAGVGNATLDQVIASTPGLLVPSRLAGFVAPAARVDAGSVALDYRGAGARSFRLVEWPGYALTPPLDPDVRGVVVREVVGRYQPATGELEWVEPAGAGPVPPARAGLARSMVVSLSSQSLSLAELVAIAEGLAAR